MGNNRNMFYLKQCLGLGMMREMGTAYADFIFITLHQKRNHLSFLESHFHLPVSLMFLLVSCSYPSCRTSVLEFWWEQTGEIQDKWFF